MVQSDLSTAARKYGNSAGSLVFSVGDKDTLVSSDAITNNFLYSTTSCSSYGDLKACQIIANLCMMTLYQDSHQACIAYKSILSDPAFAPTRAYPFQEQ